MLSVKKICCATARCFLYFVSKIGLLAFQLIFILGLSIAEPAQALVML